MVTLRVRGRGIEARETSEAAVVGVAGRGLMSGGVATMEDTSGVVGLSLPATFADALAVVEASLGGMSIFVGLAARLPSFTLASMSLAGEVAGGFFFSCVEADPLFTD